MPASSGMRGVEYCVDLDEKGVTSSRPHAIYSSIFTTNSLHRSSWWISRACCALNCVNVVKGVLQRVMACCRMRHFSGDNADL